MKSRQTSTSQSEFAVNRRDVLAGSCAAMGAIGLGNHIGRSASSESENDPTFVEITDESRASMIKGTKWLFKAINQDGGAGLDIATPSDVACTSVVGMALLSQGNTAQEGEYKTKQKALSRFLLSRVEKMGGTGSLQRERSQIEGDLGPYATHFFCTIFLSQSIGESPDLDRTRAAISRLEKYISSNQHRDGSWGQEAWAPMLATACGWLSLRAANFAGVKVSGSSDNAGEFLVRRMPRLGRSWGSGSWYHRLYGTASGLRVLYALGRDNESKAQRALADILALIEKGNRTFGGAGGEEYLTFHLMTEMLMQKGGRDWRRWYPTVRDKLIKVQNKDGSWTGHHCITSRTFSTACALMVLSAPNRYLPISQV